LKAGLLYSPQGKKGIYIPPEERFEEAGGEKERKPIYNK
jgi:hypothetical protein